MPNGPQLKNVAEKRLEAAKALQSAKDWDGAGLMLGFALECALKSACCKALRLKEYPVGRQPHDGDSHFRTHSFDRLLTISGCEDLFNPGGIGGFAWSDFLSHYDDKGKWVDERYETGSFSDQIIQDLLRVLNGNESGKEGIFTLLTNHQRW